MSWLRFGTGKLHWSRVIALAVLGVLLVFILRETLRPPANAPRRTDTQAAARTLAPPPGSREVLQPIPQQVSQGRYVAGNARVEPIGRESRVSSEVPGLIQAILVQEGQQVEQGTPLVQLDAAVEKAAAEAAQAEYDADKANLQRALTGNRWEEIAASRAEADSARAKSALSADTLRRNEQLARTGAATPQELDQARLAADADRAAALAARSRARLSAAGSRKEDITSARAKAEAAQARLDQANAALAERTVRAPMTGTVLSIAARLGEYFTPGASDPLVVMGDLGHLRARMEVDERDIGRIKLGARAYVTADAFGDKQFWATVTDVGRRMGRKTIHTDLPSERPDAEVLEVLMDLDSPGPLMPGLRVTAYVEANRPAT